MTKKSAKLILMRHGESEWNKRNYFTGWVDVPLSEKGVQEAIEGGKKIQKIPIDFVFVSTLVRAQMTAFLAMLHHESKKVCVMQHPKETQLQKWATIFGQKSKDETIPVFAAWQLNERWYGDLQGLDKDETRQKYGKEQVHIWRRSYDISPPHGESLKMTSERTIPYFQEVVIPLLQKGKHLFISAHGNSLRAILMYIQQLDKEEVVKLEIKTGDPIIYEYQDGVWKR